MKVKVRLVLDCTSNFVASFVPNFVVILVAILVASFVPNFVVILVANFVASFAAIFVGVSKWPLITRN